MAKKLFESSAIGEDEEQVKPIEIKNNFIGSKLALVVGVLNLMAGFANPDTSFGNTIAGAIIILGTTAYMSAKKRKLGLAKSIENRKVMEISALGIIVLIIIFQNNLGERLYHDPFPNVIIPIWVFIAYFFILSRKTSHNSVQVG